MGLQFLEILGWARRRKVFATLLVLFTLSVGILIGSLVSGRAVASRDQRATGASLLAVPDPVTLSNAFSGISKKIGPAVVNISTTQILDKPKTAPKKPKSPNDPFEDFYNKYFDSPDNGPDAERSLGPA